MSAEPNTLRIQIRDALLARIRTGSLAPGDRLVEMRLAREFQTSQTPVREALRELEALGYVITATHRGTSVREVQATEARDALRVRAVLEGEAARLAAQAGGDWRALRTAVRGIETAVRTGDAAGYRRYDEAFHRGLVERAGNPVLVALWTRLLVPAHLSAAGASGTLDMEVTGGQHRWILDALERGEVEVAGRRASDHMDAVASLLDGATD